jgi:hypothetical protein
MRPWEYLSYTKLSLKADEELHDIEDSDQENALSKLYDRDKSANFIPTVLIILLVTFTITSIGATYALRQLLYPEAVLDTEDRTISLERSKHSPHEPPPKMHTSTVCGNNTDYALASGCVLDIISRSWQEPGCYDAELIDSFLELSDWHFYSDRERTDEVALKSIQDGTFDGEIWVNWLFHLHHCTYMWRKLHRAMIDGRAIDSYAGGYWHTEHCAQALTTDVEDWEQATVAFVPKFPACGAIEMFQ